MHSVYAEFMLYVHLLLTQQELCFDSYHVATTLLVAGPTLTLWIHA